MPTSRENRAEVFAPLFVEVVYERSVASGDDGGKRQPSAPCASSARLVPQNKIYSVSLLHYPRAVLMLYIGDLNMKATTARPDNLAPESLAQSLAPSA